ncbi:MAG TPA: hypothetical protein VLB86_16180 [Gaiellaceae bacterium]|nr:hypothetical protein [Gaiellaceae bacterium]
MRRTLLFGILLLAAFPAVAQPKELTGFRLCGPDGCATIRLTGFGHHDPFAGETAAAAPGPYRRATLLVDRSGTWAMFYVRATGRLAFLDVEGRTVRWMRPVPTIATALEDAARDVRAYPGPRITAVRVGTRRLEAGAASYLQLLGRRGAYADPGTGTAEPIRFETAQPLTYHPDTDVLVGGGRWIRLPRDVAASLEAGRPLDAAVSDGASPWAVAAAVAAATLAAAGLALLVQRRDRAESAPAPAA